MAEWLKVVILGIIEGVTEFLPISSTGHLIVAAEFIQLRESLRGTFEIFIQFGAVLAVIAFYWSDLFRQLRTVRTDSEVQRLWLGVLVAFIPAAVVGLLLEEAIEAVLFGPVPVAIALIVGGVIFLVIEWRGVADGADESIELKDVTVRQAFLIGVAQTFALIPGMSRSGASIVGGLFVGLNRRVATQFSFYLAIPTLGAATIYTLAQSLDAISGSDAFLLFLGMVVSGIVAWFSIGWLLRYVSNNNFIAFGYYRIVVGIIILLIVYFI